MSTCTECSVCSDICTTDSVQCKDCQQWSHFRCQKVLKHDRTFWNEKSLAFHCSSCRSTTDGSFDYLQGLARIRRDAELGMDQLKIGVQREQLLLKSVPFDTSPHKDFNKLEQDKVANAILNHFSTSTKTALRSTGNGDCLFNSLSILLVGNESRCTELRYRCCLEMVTKKEKLERHRAFTGEKSLEPLAPSYVDDCIGCTKRYNWCSMWHILAMSHLLAVKVEVVYPFVNGSKTYSCRRMNLVFKPPFVDPEKPTLTIMWSSISPPTRIKFGQSRTVSWSSNHLVPLVHTFSQREAVTLDFDETATSNSSAKCPIVIDKDKTTKTKNKTAHVKVGKGGSWTTPGVRHTNHTGKQAKSKLKRTKQTKFSKMAYMYSSMASDSTTNQSKPHYSTGSDIPGMPRTSHTDSESTFIFLDNPYKSNLSAISEEDDTPRSPTDLDSSYESCRHDETEDMSIDELEEREGEDDAEHDQEEEEAVFQPGPLKHFMELKETIELLKGPHSVLQEIPVGRKDGMYYIMDNRQNIENRSANKPSQFWDDCGSWTKGTSPCSFFIHRDGNLMTVMRRDDQYCVRKQINGRIGFVPLEPQPEDGEIVVVHRSYTLLKNSQTEPSFKRRVTWIENSRSALPQILQDVAVVEYIGTFPGRRMHGHAKDTENSAPYVRTKPRVFDELKTKLSNRPVKEVERELNEEIEDDFGKQRNEKQLRNIKHNITKGDQKAKTTPNIADQVICVEELVKTHDFVQSVRHVKETQNPLVTLYTKQQIHDIKRFCCKAEGRCVLGMDKTYNLGEFHVTTTVYKDLSVIKRSSNDHPLCVGPAFIHQSSTTKAYSTFLHEIADELTDNEIANLTIGTDEELAFKSSIRRCFRGCTHVHCTRHLRTNADDYMYNKVGHPKPVRAELLNAIYGPEGLTANTDIDTFNHRIERITSSVEVKDQHVIGRKLLPHLQTNIIPTIKQYVREPVLAGRINSSWTNNNCESINHVLKSAVKWKAQDMPKFINIVYGIVKSDQEERCRAIRDTGNFRLSPRYIITRLTSAIGRPCQRRIERTE